MKYTKKVKRLEKRQSDYEALEQREKMSRRKPGSFKKVE